MEYCNFCKEEGLVEDAVAFCGKCRKYLCISCIKSHGKFLRDHVLSFGTEMPSKGAAESYRLCEIHTNQAVELFCEEHCCVFCKFCKTLEHDNCALRTIQDVVKHTDLREEFDASFTKLTELCEVINEKLDATQSKIETYSVEKRNMETRLTALHKELNDLILSHLKRLGNQEKGDLEMLNAKQQSYRSFHQYLKSLLNLKESMDEETSREHLFNSLVELKQSYKKYNGLMEKLISDTTEHDFFVLKDQSLPSLIQELAGVGRLEIEPRSQMSSASESPNSRADRPQRLTIEHSCQTDITLSHHLNTPTHERCRRNDNDPLDKSEDVKDDQTDNVDNTECGSSDEVCEMPFQISFYNIEHLTLIKEARGYGKKYFFLPNGEAMNFSENQVNFLDSDMKLKLILEGQTEYLPRHVAVIDSKSVVISFLNKNVLQIIYVEPSISFGKELTLDICCDSLACHRKKLYVYTDSMDVSCRFKYSGIKIISLSGDVLKSIVLLDKVTSFIVNKAGNIIYLTTRPCILKCVTTDGTVVFEYSRKRPDTFIIDEEGNMMICDNSTGHIGVVKLDGTSEKVAVVDNPNELLSSSLSYNKYKKTLWILLERKKYRPFQDEIWKVLQIYDMKTK